MTIPSWNQRVACFLVAAALVVGHPALCADSPSGFRGSEKAPVSVLAFFDFESFPCARAADLLSGILVQTKDVRLIFKHAPAATNPNAALAHEAALAAGAQGKFWEMHDLLFANQTKLTRADLLTYATQLNLNLPTFQQALDAHTYRPIIERDLAEAKALGVTSTPTLFHKWAPPRRSPGLFLPECRHLHRARGYPEIPARPTRPHLRGPRPVL
jgi:hypothetical protein